MVRIPCRIVEIHLQGQAPGTAELQLVHLVRNGMGDPGEAAFLRRSMKNLFEIISMAEGGEMPSHEDCYYALLALNMILDQHKTLIRDLVLERRLVEEGRKDRRPAVDVSGTLVACRGAMYQPPKEWIGPEWDPMGEVSRKRREDGREVVLELAKRIRDSKHKG